MAERPVRPTDDELVRLHAIDGVRGVFAKGVEHGIALVKHELADAHELEDALFEIVLKLGFTGVGLGKRHAIMQSMEWMARNRKSNASGGNRG